MFAYSIGNVGIIIAMANPLQTLLGNFFTPEITKYFAVAIIIVQACINIFGIRLAAHLNRLAVYAEIVVLLVCGMVLLLVTGMKGHIATEMFFVVPKTPVPYLPVFLSAVLLPAFTIFGFETSSDLSEETKNVKRVAPKSIITSVLAVTLLGFFFIVVLTLSIQDLGQIKSAADPISAIILSDLGLLPTKMLLFFVLLAMFATPLIGITTASRLLFAIARENHVLGSSFFKKVSPNKVPVNSVIAIAAVEILTLLTVSGVLAMYTSAVVLLSLVYLLTVVSFAFRSHKLPVSHTFSLGKWHWLVVFFSCLWLVFEISIFVFPAEYHLSTVIAGGVIIVGFLQYLMVRVFNH